MELQLEDVRSFLETQSPDPQPFREYYFSLDREATAPCPRAYFCVTLFSTKSRWDWLTDDERNAAWLMIAEAWEKVWVAHGPGEEGKDEAEKILKTKMAAVASLRKYLQGKGWTLQSDKNDIKKWVA